MQTFEKLEWVNLFNKLTDLRSILKNTEDLTEYSQEIETVERDFTLFHAKIMLRISQFSRSLDIVFKDWFCYPCIPKLLWINRHELIAVNAPLDKIIRCFLRLDVFWKGVPFSRRRCVDTITPIPSPKIVPVFNVLLNVWLC